MKTLKSSSSEDGVLLFDVIQHESSDVSGHLQCMNCHENPSKGDFGLLVTGSMEGNPWCLVCARGRTKPGAPYHYMPKDPELHAYLDQLWTRKRLRALAVDLHHLHRRLNEVHEEAVKLMPRCPHVNEDGTSAIHETPTAGHYACGICQATTLDLLKGYAPGGSKEQP